MFLCISRADYSTAWGKPLKSFFSKLLYFHTTHEIFSQIHLNPFPFYTHSTLCSPFKDLEFILYSSSLICAVHLLLNMLPSTRVWSTYQELHYFFLKKKTVFSSSSSGQLSIAPRLRGRLHTTPLSMLELFLDWVHMGFAHAVTNDGSSYVQAASCDLRMLFT